MKKISLLAALFVLSIGAHAALDKPVQPTGKKDLFTYEEQALVEQKLSQECGDTWCEGDYRYHFSLPECDSGTHECIFSFDMIPAFTDPAKPVSSGEGFASLATDVAAHIGECKIPNVTALSDLIVDRGERTAPNGRVWRAIELNQTFYQKMNACIESIENLKKKN